jgi:hypothetical protein
MVPSSLTPLASRVAAAAAIVGCCPSGCCPNAGAPPAPAVAAATPHKPAAVIQPERPQLLVAVVFDQLGSDTLLRSWPALDPNGALRVAASRGAFYERGVFPYLNTLTAPGHAAIFSGASPAQSGIGGNDDWDDAAGAAVSVVEGLGNAVFGHAGATVGAHRLRAETVAQSLKRHSNGAAKVVSIAMKDRAAVFSVGHGADLALWYDAALGRFTSSEYCVDELPAWVTEHQAAHPLAQLLTPWQPQSPELYEQLLGPDDAPGEGSGWEATFPHDPRTTAQPNSSLRLLPSMSNYVVALADRAVSHHQLGSDDVPDLLVVGISGTDYVGHTFGPHSWEYLDHLVRSDAAVGAWLERLERRFRLTVMLTSDHGVAPLPEYTSARGGVSGRVFPQQMQEQVEAVLDAELGASDWVAGIVGALVHFTPAAKQRADFPRALELSRAALSALPGVGEVRRVSDLVPLARAGETRHRQATASVPAGSTADLMVDTQPFFIFGYGAPPGSGTHHGSGHEYDQQVPLLFYGHGVHPSRVTSPVSQLRIAATLAGLLGVPAPSQAEAPALDVASSGVASR